MTVLIKRYANRKLYNTETSRYITLRGISELVEQGTDVRVIDNETGEDITSVTLSQVLVEGERSNRTVPRTLLSDLIQRSGDALYGALKRGVGDASEGWGEFQRNVRRVIRSREQDAARLRDSFADVRGEWDHLVQNAVERVFRALDLPRRSDIEALSENLERVAKALERLESKPTQSARSESKASADQRIDPEGDGSGLD
ncbi:MAG TPA: polyhydroxyalkanoate synthesis regulator DNA-binding domain-containing protein [Myxococcota bacterium]|nr:polyhydroxyalkanoate synthesis regulator DNA-binding domain-containing protein [Myxococcota bacterium]